MKINIAIVDDHQIVIDGLKFLLNDNPRFNIKLESTDGMQMLDMLKVTYY
jgi:DNA-binding NarL/FixJ family response regulator